jgi:YHS domain-containing protein
MAQERVLTHTDSSGVAVSGYDPVAFFTEARPVKGMVEHRLVYKGALYLFTSRENLEAFQSDPEKFEPRFGGYCPVSLADDSLAPGDASHFRVIGDDLYLLHDAAAAQRFKEEQVAFAERYWQKQVESKGLVYIPAVEGN